METARRACLPAFGPHVVWWVAFSPSFAGLARTCFVVTNPNCEMPVFTVASLTSSVMNPYVYPGVPKTVRRRPSCLPTRGRCMRRCCVGLRYRRARKHVRILVFYKWRTRSYLFMFCHCTGLARRDCKLITLSCCIRSARLRLGMRSCSREYHQFGSARGDFVRAPERPIRPEFMISVFG